VALVALEFGVPLAIGRAVVDGVDPTKLASALTGVASRPTDGPAGSDSPEIILTAA
jgi:hypothetical protein